MIRNDFITAFRRMAKRRVLTFILALGLSVGFAATLLISHLVFHELRYDRYHPASDRLYRLTLHRTTDAGTAVHFASCAPPAAPQIRSQFPEVELITRLFHQEATVSVENRHFTERRLFFADPELFQMFSLPVLHGDVSRFSRSNTAVISRRAAAKYFGFDSVVGKSIIVNGEEAYEIVGVFETPPSRTHLDLDVVLSYTTLLRLRGPEYHEAWGHTGVYTYVQLKPGSDAAAFDRKLDAMVDTYFGDVLKNYNMTMTIDLQPVTDIHLHSQLLQELEPGGDARTIGFLPLIALMILLLAWLNTINLSTAQAMERAREVGMRKVTGAGRTQLIRQFLTETIVLNLIALLISFGLVETLVPLIAFLSGTTASVSLWHEPVSWTLLLIMFVISVLCSGMYPAFMLARVKPVQVLKNQMVSSPGGVRTRKLLAAIQFAIALGLTAGTLLIARQLQHLRTQDTGCRLERVLVIQAPRVIPDGYDIHMDSFKTAAGNLTGVERVAFTSQVPGRQIMWDAGGIRKMGDPDENSRNYMIVGIDDQYVPLLDLDLAAGRNFSRKRPSDRSALLLNERAVQWLGFTSPRDAVGQAVDYWGEIFTVIGVVRDFHQQSSKWDFEPHIFRYMEQDPRGRGQLMISFSSPAGERETASILALYNRFFPGNTVETFWLDTHYDQQYKPETRFGSTFALFAAMALLVNCLGLIGLAIHNTSSRSREVGIRKVLGASTAGITGQLLHEYVLLMVIASCIAFPTTYLIGTAWLKHYASRTPLGPGLVFWPFVLVATVSIATIGIQLLRLARMNPAQVLKAE